MFKDAQKEIDDWVQMHEKPYWAPLSQLARLTEEVGEVARLMNHLYGDKPKKQQEVVQDLSEEISDVLFTLICIANSNTIDLDEAFKKSMEKCYGRDKDRFAKK